MSRHVCRTRVRTLWEHQPYVDTSQSCYLQSLVQPFGRKEIRGLDKYIFLGIGNREDGRLQERAPLSDGAAGADLHDIIVRIDRKRWIVNLVVQEFLADHVPIDKESRLQTMYTFSDNLEMRVPPCPPTGSFRVAVCNVHAAHKTDFTVYDNDFPVVPVVYLAGEDRERYFQEGVDLDTGTRHFLEELVFHVPATYIVVKNTDFDSFFGFFDQQFFDLITNFVVAEDIILDVYMMGCPRNLL